MFKCLNRESQEEIIILEARWLALIAQLRAVINERLVEALINPLFKRIRVGYVLPDVCGAGDWCGAVARGWGQCVHARIHSAKRRPDSDGDGTPIWLATDSVRNTPRVNT